MQLRLLRLSKILSLVIILSIIQGCKEGPEFQIVPIDQSLVLDFHLMHGTEEISLDDAFVDNQGFNVEVLSLKFFLSHIKLTDSSGVENEISEVKFVDFQPIDTTILNPQWGKSPKMFIPNGQYSKLKFGIGLSHEQNFGDPTTYENDDPLGAYTNMFWTWATQYRFIILEAKADTFGGNNIDYNILFHTGLDSLYAGDLEFEIDLNAQSFQKDTLHFDIDWDRLFDGVHQIDLKAQSVTHTTDTPEDFELARIFTENFVSALSLRQNN